MSRQLARHHNADRRRVAVPEVVGAFDRRDDANPKRPGTPLLHQVVLREEVDGAVARAQDADLQAAHQAEPVFQSDDRARVEAEEVLCRGAEVPLAEGTAESMRDPERALEPRDAQRRRQIHDREVGLRRIRIAIRVIVGGRRRRRRRILSRERTPRGGQREHQKERYRTNHRVFASRFTVAAASAAAGTARTTRTPVIASCWSPQYSEQRIGKRPSSPAVNSMVTGVVPRGISFFTLNFLISRPWTPSADRTTSRRRSPTVASISAGSNVNRRAMTSMTLGSGACAAG